MRPLWGKKIIAVTTKGQPQEPLIEITGPKSETIDAGAAKRHLGKTVDAMTREMKVVERGSPQGTGTESDRGALRGCRMNSSRSS